MAGVVGRRAAVVAVLVLSACTPRPEVELAGSAPLPAEAAWDSTLAGVRTLLGERRYLAADSALAAYETRYAGTAQSGDARWWRAVLQLDPQNPDGSPRGAIAAIDAYLAGGIEQPRYAEALVLRRTAESLDRPAPAPLPTRPDSAPPDSLGSTRLRAATDTIRALRTELERTQAELDRVRRRIRPGPPLAP
jgi:hypothetical protein